MVTDTRPPAPTSTAPEPSGPRPPGLGEAIGRALRTLAIVVVAGAIGVGGLTVWTLLVSTSADRTTSHPAVGRVALDLGANGGVEVRVHDGDEILVEERIRTSLGDLEPEIGVDGDELAISTPRCGVWTDWLNPLPMSRCYASFVLTVPAGTEVVGAVRHGAITVQGPTGPVAMETGHGAIDVTGVPAEVALRTGHGRVALNDVDGDAIVDTDHGRIQVTGGAGTLEATTGHGRVAVTDRAGPLALQTDHGRVEVARVDAQTISLRTGHGRVEVDTTTSPSLLQARTDHGRMTITVPDDGSPYAVATDTSGSTNVEVPTDPSAERRLELSTGHGDIDVLTR